MRTVSPQYVLCRTYCVLCPVTCALLMPSVYRCFSSTGAMCTAGVLCSREKGTDNSPHRADARVEIELGALPQAGRVSHHTSPVNGGIPPGSPACATRHRKRCLCEKSSFIGVEYVLIQAERAVYERRREDERRGEDEREVKERTRNGVEMRFLRRGGARGERKVYERRREERRG